MILRFRFRNFRSFRKEQELSLIASNLGDLPDVVRRPKGLSEGLLPVAAIYGANASGKSNVLMGLSFMEEAVRNSQRTWSPDKPIRVDPFLLAGEQDNTMTFEVDLLIEGVQYEYGFSLDSERIHREWLNAYPSGRKQTWFSRDVGQPRVFKFGKQLSGENRAIENLTRKNSLFLSAAAQNNHEQLLPIYNWFGDKLFFISDRRPFQSLIQLTAELCKDDTVRARVSSLLAAADLGIVGVDVSEEAPDENFAKFLQALRTEYSSTDAGPMFDGVDTRQPSLSVAWRHRGFGSTEIPFRESQESAGTLIWFGLLGQVLHAIEDGSTLCVDELDSSLHPLLAAEIVRYFNDPKRNSNGAQLIFNTHDTNLLDATLLRRDQVWFVEKDRAGSSHLYPLTDFKPRRHENLERGYLQGRYGAIPFVGELNPAPESSDAQ